MAAAICVIAGFSLLAFMWWKFVHLPIQQIGEALDEAFNGDRQK